MAVEPIICLTRSKVLDVLKEVTFVVHTVVHQKSTVSGNQIKMDRALYAKKKTLPLNVDQKENTCFGLQFHFSRVSSSGVMPTPTCGCRNA